MLSFSKLLIIIGIRRKVLDSETFFFVFTRRGSQVQALYRPPSNQWLRVGADHKRGKLGVYPQEPGRPRSERAFGRSGNSWYSSAS